MNLDTVEEEKKITLVSKQGDEYTILAKNASISGLITSALSDESAKEIPLDVNGLVLENIVEFMNHRKGDSQISVEKPLKSTDMKIACSNKWEAEFIDKLGENKKLLYDFILASNYMDIQASLHLGSAKVASMLKGQPIDKIKDILAC